MRLISIWMVVILITSFIPGPTIQKVVKVNKVVYSAVDDLPFSEENLMIVIKKMGIRFPDVVVAQAKLETGHFTSKSFTRCNNLFGMKMAKSRLTVASNERYGHASYDHWTYSVMDYALFQSTFARKIRTKDKYLLYLQSNYAEDKTYVDKIKKLIR
jgi:uncharacterized FlgJ-related protein